MKRSKNPLPVLVPVLILLAAGAFSPIFAGDDTATEIRVKRVHKVVIDCEDGSAEDCEQKIHIETGDDGSHVMHVGDHQMTWVQGGEHGAHYSFGSSFAGKGGFLGVQLTDLTPELRAHFGVATDEGVMVAKVVDDSAAFRAGLAAGDIITRIEGEPMRSSGDITDAIRSREEGERVIVEVWRQGTIEALSATLDQTDQLAGLRHHVVLDCDEEDGDCGAMFVGRPHHGMASDCPDGAEECEIKVDCDGGDCECTVNGESVACEDLHTEHGPGD